MTQPTEKQGNHAITIGSVFLAICQHYRAKTMRHGGVDAIRPSITYEDACFLSILIVSRRTCSFVMRCNDGFQ